MIPKRVRRQLRAQEHSRIRLPRPAFLALAGLTILAAAIFSQAAAVPSEPPMFVQWGSGQHISTSSGFGAFIPVIDADSNGRIMIMYNHNTGTGIENPLFRESVDGGFNWSPPAPVATTNQNSQEIDFDFNQNDVAHAVWRTQNQVLHARESQWPNGSNTIVSGSDRVFSPDIAIGADNSLHVVWSQEDNKIYYSRSQNGGSSWTTPAALSGATNKSDNPAVAVDQSNNVHVVWEERIFDPTIPGFRFQINYKKGTVSGSSVTWSGSPTKVSGSVAEARLPDVLAEGNKIHVAFARRESNEEQYAYYSSFVPGSGWNNAQDTTLGNPVSMNTNVPFVLDVTLAACNNSVYLYYHGAVGVNAKEQILGADSNSNWSPLDVVTDGQERTIRPTLVCSDGWLHLAFDQVVVPDTNHQIYYLRGVGNTIFLPMVARK